MLLLVLLIEQTIKRVFYSDYAIGYACLDSDSRMLLPCRSAISFTAHVSIRLVLSTMRKELTNIAHWASSACPTPDSLNPTLG